MKESFREAHTHYGFRLAAFVILPDHWHALIRPVVGVVIEQVVGAVKKVVLRDLSAQSTIWQPRFLDRRVRNEEEFWFYYGYIQMNPKKHGYVNEGEDYKWLFIHPKPFG